MKFDINGIELNSENVVRTIAKQSGVRLLFVDTRDNMIYVKDPITTEESSYNLETLIESGRLHMQDRNKIKAVLDNMKKGSLSGEVEFRFRIAESTEYTYFKGIYTMEPGNPIAVCTARDISDVMSCREQLNFINGNMNPDEITTEKQFLYHAFAHDYYSVDIINAKTFEVKELKGDLSQYSETEKIENYDIVMSRYLVDKVSDDKIEDLIDRTRINRVIAELDKQEVYIVQFEATNNKGKVRSFQLEYAYIDKSAGLIVASMTDITETVRQNKNQKELISMALERLDKASRAKESFFANMSHEIRTPLNAIVGMAEIAKENIDNKDRVTECCDIMISSAMELTNVVGNILDSSNFEAGTIRFKEKPTNIAQAILDIVDEFNASYKKKNQEFTYKVDVKHEIALIDEERLRRVLLNVLSNAAKFSPNDGKISLLVAEQEGNDTNGTYVFEIADNGKGIDKNHIDHVFDPFFSEKDISGNYSGGPGLGLSVVKNIADAKGVKLSIESTPNKGTVVRFVAPVTFVENDVIVRKRTEIQKVLEGKRALLVEDQRANRLVANNMLKRFGADVVIAENGKEAYDIYMGHEAYYFDLILMDIQMPVMNGYDSTRLIRNSQKPDAKDIKIIAMTADVLPKDIELAKQAGMDEHIGKPIQPAYVQNVFMTLFEEKGDTDE